MKLKFVLLLIALCLVLCACGGNTQDAGNTEPSATEGTLTEGTADPTDKGLFVTEDPDDVFIGLPEDIQGIELPLDEFEDDQPPVPVTSQPVTDSEETEPEETEPEVTDAPTKPAVEGPNNYGSDELPLHEWE